MYVCSLTASLIFSNKIDTKLKHILLFQKNPNMAPGTEHVRGAYRIVKTLYSYTLSTNHVTRWSRHQTPNFTEK